jgi:hypothetical protein
MEIIEIIVSIAVLIFIEVLQIGMAAFFRWLHNWDFEETALTMAFVYSVVLSALCTAHILSNIFPA